MFTQIDPAIVYNVDVLFRFDRAGLQPAKTDAQLNTLFDRELLSFGATRDSYHRASFTADARRLAAFIKFAHRLAKENTFYLVECTITQPPRPLEKLSDDDWVLVHPDHHYALNHDGLSVHAMRIPDSCHWNSGGTGVSAQALEWLKAHVTSGYQTYPLGNASPVLARDWFTLWPDNYLGPGLDHPLHQPRVISPPDPKAFPPYSDPQGNPRVTIGVKPEGDFPTNSNQEYKWCNARAGAILTDPLLNALAQSTLTRSLELCGHRTFLRDQTPPNADIAWFYASDPYVALRAHLARGLVKAALATPDLFIACDTVDAPPHGCQRLPNTTPPLFYFKREYREPEARALPTDDKIKTPTWKSFAEALATFAARHQARKKNWSPWTIDLAASDLIKLPTLWRELVALPETNELVVELPGDIKPFTGRIKNPKILPPHSSLLDVAGSGDGDSFLLLVPPSPTLTSPARLLWKYLHPAPWHDCPVAWHDHEINRIACVWPSILHFAVDRLASQRQWWERYWQEEDEKARKNNPAGN